ncbi:ATP-binding cassette domain-containing protein [Micromonospora radicis]|uniref:ATP-binding cassette domain-containing protein n=1 Tax=Micromonospora radicis TaxID=1894971 RepID=UPI00267A4F2F
MSGPICETEHLEKWYGQTAALRDVSLTVDRGEIVAVTGPSGCGKSTLLHCLSGILRPDRGSVRFAGREIGTAGEAARSRLRRTAFGVLFQFGQIVPETDRRRERDPAAATRCWRVLLPAVPGIVLAGLVGMLGMRAFTGSATATWSRQFCVGTPAQCAGAEAGRYLEYRVATHTLTTPVPWAEIGAIMSFALLAVLLVIAVSVLLQRSSTNPAELRTG